MCYKKPGPRCSNHARSALREARKAFNEANRAHANDPSDATEKKLTEAAKEYKKVKGEYYTTEAGWGELQAKIAQAKTEETKARLTQRLQDYQDRRGAMLSRYKAEEGALDGEGLSASERAKDAELVAKHDGVGGSTPIMTTEHLPADRRDWQFDKDTGYASAEDVAKVPNCEPLSKVHTGDGTDYLAANQLTEYHGWTTDDAWGELEDPFYIKPYAKRDEYDNINFSYEALVTTVTVKNINSGEVRKVWRVSTENNKWDTFGSREEAEARLAKEGTLLTEDEYERRLKIEVEEHDEDLTNAFNEYYEQFVTDWRE